MRVVPEARELSYMERTAALDLPILEGRRTREGMIITSKFLSGFDDRY